MLRPKRWFGWWIAPMDEKCAHLPPPVPNSVRWPSLRRRRPGCMRCRSALWDMWGTADRVGLVRKEQGEPSRCRLLGCREGQGCWRNHSGRPEERLLFTPEVQPMGAIPWRIAQMTAWVRSFTSSFS